MKKSRKEKINQFLDIPKEIGSNVPKITVVGFEELLIENYKGIIEYEDFFVRISTHIGNISINGFELNLNEMTEDDILVTGKIESVDFEER